MCEFIHMLMNFFHECFSFFFLSKIKILNKIILEKKIYAYMIVFNNIKSSVVAELKFFYAN